MQVRKNFSREFFENLLKWLKEIQLDLEFYIFFKSFRLFDEILHQHFNDGSPYHKETSTFICEANQWTGAYMIGNSVMKEFTHFVPMPS